MRKGEAVLRYRTAELYFIPHMVPRTGWKMTMLERLTKRIRRKFKPKRNEILILSTIQR
jgi:hypothetical protein